MTPRIRGNTPYREGVTVAFDLAAVEALRNPSRVFSEVDEWSEHIGIIDDDTAEIYEVVEKFDLPQSYDLSEMDAQSAMSRLKWEAETERFIYISGDDDAEELTEYVGWEYIEIQKAANENNWRLGKKSGFMDSLRSLMNR